MKEGKSNHVLTEKEEQLPKYEPPKVVSLTKDQILEELGPARACYNHSGTVIC